jgi:hypothetical protein
MKWKWAAHKYAAHKFASGRFAGLGVDVAPYVPILHYHTIEGPSKQIRTLVGPQLTPHTLEGPSKQIRTLKGSC